MHSVADGASRAMRGLRSVIHDPLGAVDERPVYVLLTVERVAISAGARAAQGGSAASLAALLSKRADRERMPPIEVWEERARGEAVESRFSFSLVRGLLLLAHLANGQPASLTDLAANLNLAHTYVRTLLMAGLVKQDPETCLYQLAE